MLTALRNPRTDLPWLITLHAVAFVGFHGVVAINTSLWFQRLTWMQYDWLRELVGIWGFDVWTLGLSIYLAYIFLSNNMNRAATGASFLISAYSYYVYKYPVATSMLVEFGQFETIGYFVHSQLPDFGLVSHSSR